MLADKPRGVFRSVLRAWRGFDLPLVWTLGAVAFPLGVLGFGQHDGAMSYPERIYRTLQLYFLNLGDLKGLIPWQLEAARFMAPIVTIYSVGRAMGILFDEQLTRVRLRFWSGHVVVLGLGRKGEQVLREHARNGIRVVAIERTDDREVRQRCRDEGAIVIEGNATRKESLRAARVAQASRVFVFCGTDDTNVAAAITSSQEKLAGGAAARRRPVDRYVHVVDRELCVALRLNALLPDGEGLFRTHVVNTFENAARTLFVDHILPYAPVDIRDPRRLRVVIVGFGQMGQAVVRQIAKSACFANEKQPEIVIVDERGNSATAPFFWLHPGVKRVCYIQYLEKRGDDPDVMRQVVAFFADNSAVTVLVLCLDNDAANLVNAVSFRAQIPLTKGTPPIFVRASDEAGIGTLLKTGAHHGKAGSNSAPKLELEPGILAFGSVDDTCRESVLVGALLDERARQIHEKYVSDRKKGKHQADDPALAPWEGLTEDLRDSNRQQADHIDVKMRTIGRDPYATDLPWTSLTEAEIDLLARLEHHRWNVERKVAGWTAGPRDPVRKTSPYLVSWDRLDETIRNYDRASVRNMELLIKSSSAAAPGGRGRVT